MKPSQLPFVSVIIPVFNDNRRLQLCLSALSEQTYAQAAYEIIVVDNNSPEKVSLVTDNFAQVRTTYEASPGSYVARNKGVEVAKGAVIAFTDSDCIPQPDWLEQGVRCLFSTQHCGLVAGKVELFFQDPDAPTAAELFDFFALNFNQRQKLENAHYGMTANVFTFRDVLSAVGCFDGQLKSGGDRIWGQQVYAAGYQQLYAEEACVLHPARHSLSDLRKRIVRLTGGKFDKMMRQNPSAKAIALDLLGTMRPPLRSLYKAWTSPKLPRYRQKTALIFAMLFVHSVIAVEKIRLYMGGTTHRG